MFLKMKTVLFFDSSTPTFQFLDYRIHVSEQVIFRSLTRETLHTEAISKRSKELAETRLYFKTEIFFNNLYRFLKMSSEIRKGGISGCRKNVRIRNVFLTTALDTLGCLTQSWHVAILNH